MCNMAVSLFLVAYGECELLCDLRGKLHGRGLIMRYDADRTRTTVWAAWIKQASTGVMRPSLLAAGGSKCADIEPVAFDCGLRSAGDDLKPGQRKDVDDAAEQGRDKDTG